MLSTSNTKLLYDGIQQVAELKRFKQDKKSGEITEETLILITNLPEEQLSAKALLELNRNYWGIENKLHYRKDFVFGEDRSTIRKGHGPRNMAVFRNFAISLFHLCGVENIKRCVDNIRYSTLEFFRHAFCLTS